MAEYELGSPVMTLTFDRRPRHFKALVAAWVLFWLTVVVGIVYLYAVVFANRVGFETALLVGIALIAIGLGSND